MDQFGSRGTFTYQGIINSQFNATTSELFTKARKIADMKAGDERNNYMFAVETAANVYTGTSTDPTRRAGTAASGVLWFVSDTYVARDGTRAAGVDRSRVRNALANGLMGDADDESSPNDLVVAGTRSSGDISNRQLQALVFPNVPGFVFFRVISPPDALQPMVVVMDPITGN